MDDSNFYQRVYEYVKLVPLGKVTTYGQIAAAIGRPKASRVVGYALHKNPNPQEIPCHRVVNREGKLTESFAFGGAKEQKRRLEAEGVEVKKNRVDLDRYLFHLW